LLRDGDRVLADTLLDCAKGKWLFSATVADDKTSRLFLDGPRRRIRFQAPWATVVGAGYRARAHRCREFVLADSLEGRIKNMPQSANIQRTDAVKKNGPLVCACCVGSAVGISLGSVMPA
jgi:hypothetical protein